ncbi:MAG: nucleotidyl transferase AbiEii/AbiGii toxin family protein [Pseudomonadota bacterium]
MNDELLEELLKVEEDLARKRIRLVLGGGMSLYLRHRYLRRDPERRYPIQIESRSTNDLDFYFTADLIVNRQAAEGVKECLSRLGYSLLAKNFQFVKEVQTQGGPRTFKVDLLAQPPKEGDSPLVDVKPPRIKPKGARGIHAYLTEEAEGIDIGIVEVDLKPLSDGKVYLPSSFNYLIMKLHAFNDRKDREDEKSDRGRHHALDIFVTVSRMNAEDWEIARKHLARDRSRPYLKEAAEIRKACFSRPTDVGLTRLRENELYRRDRETLDNYLQPFIEDLSALFPEE